MLFWKYVCQPGFQVIKGGSRCSERLLASPKTLTRNRWAHHETPYTSEVGRRGRCSLKCTGNMSLTEPLRMARAFLLKRMGDGTGWVELVFEMIWGSARGAA